MQADSQALHQDRACWVFVGIDVDGVSVEKGLGIAPVGRHSAGRYAYAWGIPRYLELFQELGINATFFVPGYDAEVAPELVRRIASFGHEVAAHGYEHEPERIADKATEERLLLRTHRILTDLAGAPPVGWRNPGGIKTSQTHQLLRALNYIYDSSDKNRAVPYVIEEGGLDLVSLPTNTSVLDDSVLGEVALLPPSRILELWSEEFDFARRTGGYLPLILHGRALHGSGTPSKIGVVRGFLEYVLEAGATILTGQEIARRTLRAHSKGAR